MIGPIFLRRVSQSNGLFACVFGLRVRRELRYDLGLDAVRSFGYRPLTLASCASDCLLVESRKLGSDLCIDAACRSGYRTSILPGRPDGLMINGRLHANLSGSVSD